MIERHLWHPVAAERDVPPSAPIAVRLLGEDLVLWRDASGAAHAFDDRCPHRGTKLSIGRVCASGELECAYHGWRFDGRGHCVAIPALPQFQPPVSHAAKRHALQAAYGLIWVRLAEDGEQGPPPFEAGAQSGRLLVGAYDVATSAPRIVENFLDLSHFGFVHEGSLGDRAHLASEPCQVSADAEHGLAVSGARSWQPQSNLLADGGSMVDYGYRVVSPYNAVLVKAPQAQAGYREAIALFVCPVEPELSRVWFCLATPDANDADALRDFQHRIFEQDRSILEAQRPRRLPLAGGEVHSAADRASAAYRRWLQQRGISFGTC